MTREKGGKTYTFSLISPIRYATNSFSRSAICVVSSAPLSVSFTIMR